MRRKAHITAKLPQTIAIQEKSGMKSVRKPRILLSMGDQGEGNQQVRDQRKQDMLPPHALTARAALRIQPPAA